MAVITKVEQVHFKISDVRRGDVFAFVKPAGCRKKGEALVVTKVALTRTDNNTYVGYDYTSFGSTEWLELEMNEGTLVYKGTIDNLFE
ncbi:cytochrome c biogenesis protein [Pectobacterium phage Peat1]|uniref:Cytochrome c biogenesis protein n=1 Tax=Pectobacterium phage Peat1 TaxID=1654601 RepID=A0A0H3YEF3_9CAUD|nr:cytochrome c biogenesis protein [Pectobacterium phage Peat1]AKN21159.1 cytochrome c biogenesis protein [Pectobacterium phage Peat1]